MSRARTSLNDVACEKPTVGLLEGLCLTIQTWQSVPTLFNASEVL